MLKYMENLGADNPARDGGQQDPVRDLRVHVPELELALEKKKRQVKADAQHDADNRRWR